VVFVGVVPGRVEGDGVVGRRSWGDALHREDRFTELARRTFGEVITGSCASPDLPNTASQTAQYQLA